MLTKVGKGGVEYSVWVEEVYTAIIYTLESSQHPGPRPLPHCTQTLLSSDPQGQRGSPPANRWVSTPHPLGNVLHEPREPPPSPKGQKLDPHKAEAVWANHSQPTNTPLANLYLKINTAHVQPSSIWHNHTSRSVARLLFSKQRAPRHTTRPANQCALPYTRQNGNTHDTPDMDKRAVMHISFIYIFFLDGR